MWVDPTNKLVGWTGQKEKGGERVPILEELQLPSPLDIGLSFFNADLQQQLVQ